MRYECVTIEFNRLELAPLETQEIHIATYDLVIHLVLDTASVVECHCG